MCAVGDSMLHTLPCITIVIYPFLFPCSLPSVIATTTHGGCCCLLGGGYLRNFDEKGCNDSDANATGLGFGGGCCCLLGGGYIRDFNEKDAMTATYSIRRPRGQMCIALYGDIVGLNAPLSLSPPVLEIKNRAASLHIYLPEVYDWFPNVAIYIGF